MIFFIYSKKNLNQIILSSMNSRRVFQNIVASIVALLRYVGRSGANMTNHQLNSSEKVFKLELIKRRPRS